jgi:hypothetical protein
MLNLLKLTGDNYESVYLLEKLFIWKIKKETFLRLHSNRTIGMLDMSISEKTCDSDPSKED